VQTKYGDIVRVHFTCKFDDGATFESSVGKEPLDLTIGEDQVMPGFEKAIIGMHTGERKTVHVPAEQGYGPHDAEKVKTVRREEFPQNFNPEVGLRFKMQLSDGRENYITVTHVDETHVTLDGNHPLAGKDLIFEIELIDIVKIGPSAEANFNLAVTLQDHNEFDEAIKFYAKAIAVNPLMTEAYYNVAVAYQKKGMLDEAATCYRQVIEMNPNHEKACANLGILLKETGQYEEAVKYFERALQIKSDYAIAYYNLGNISYFNGRFEEALQLYEKAISINPEYAEAHLNIALINLLSGNFKEGWKGYEWRWKLEDNKDRRSFTQPPWDGSSLKDKTLFVYAEQGVGDEIMFASCLSEIIAQTKLCIVECDKRLIPVFNRSFPKAKVIEKIATDNPYPPELPSFDVVVPIGSLPLFLQRDLTCFPKPKAYLFPDTSKTLIWRDRFEALGNDMKIGISWRGGNNPRDRLQRSIAIDQWGELFSLRGAQFINLQYGDLTNELGEVREKLGVTIHEFEDADPLKDLDNFAAQIAALDLVISIDNATVHMAGALGLQTWVLLPFVPNWQWLMERDNSLWYPTMRLFRQQTQGDWESVLGKVRNELKLFINNFKR
jgi:FKBP-type peptidyl-prolyl cis-trans isomerase 2/lipoprotein NlpI